VSATGDRIEPRTLKGFRDFLPQAMMPREALIETARRVYRSYGFAPIDTPALELSEILTGKGGEETDRQLYRFHDPGDRDVAMRFDLTVPFMPTISGCRSSDTTSQLCGGVNRRRKVGFASSCNAISIRSARRPSPPISKRL
jgi:hypothetical protein